MYVRKVASSIDHNLFEILPVDDPEEIPSISWPKEVEISPAPDWEEKLTELKRKHEAEKAKAEVEKDDGVQHMEQEQAGTREVANEKVDKVASPREKTKDKEADVNPEQHGGLEEEDNSEGHKSEHNAEDQLLEM